MNPEDDYGMVFEEDDRLIVGIPDWLYRIVEWVSPGRFEVVPGDEDCSHLMGKPTYKDFLRLALFGAPVCFVLGILVGKLIAFVFLQ